MSRTDPEVDPHGYIAGAQTMLKVIIVAETIAALALAGLLIFGR